MKTAIIGGGAAGFFLAVNLKEMMPEMEVTIFERGQRVLRKVEISGGGRCNCTNTFDGVKDLSAVYPRGHRLMKRLFKTFDYHDAYEWFERHGVRLTVQEDQCVFPASQDSHTIINCLTHEARRRGVEIRIGAAVSSLDDLAGFDHIAVTTGGQPRMSGLQWLADMGHEIIPPVPSLFTFEIGDKALTEMTGTVADTATVMLPGTKLRASGPLLITHWGMSGPAILRLSSYAARHLFEHDYHCPLSVNWASRHDADTSEALTAIAIRQPQKQVTSTPPFNLTRRLWEYLAGKSLGNRAQRRWAELSKKDHHLLVNILCNDTYDITGKGTFKDEFVTCGGVSLASVNPATLESRVCPHLYFAGEVLDIDGVTGGFNFQAAWTTAYTVARAITTSPPTPHQRARGVDSDFGHT